MNRISLMMAAWWEHAEATNSRAERGKPAPGIKSGASWWKHPQRMRGWVASDW